jgi:DNA-binding response OmpR family regulator
MIRILIIDDNLSLQKSLEIFLTSRDFEVFKASDGLQGIELAYAINPYIIVLDLMLPKMDGFEVCKIIKSKVNIPIIVLSAKEQEADRLLAFEVGADDYLTKPFSLKELEFRIKARLRQFNKNFDDQLLFDNLKIDSNLRQVFIDDQAINLTSIEYKLLWELASNPNKLLKSEFLFKKIWDDSSNVTSNLLNVYIRKLRNKLKEDPKNPRHIQTVWGEGYIFQA